LSDLNTRRGSIVVLTAPSGSGKTTIARRVLEAVPEMRFSVSATTRPPRPNERDGIDYHFMSVDEFRRRVRKGDLLEYEEVYPDRFYGTLRSEVETATPEKPVMLDVDVKGALSVKRIFGDRALVIFIRPPSIESLEERLRLRGTESAETLRQRLDRATVELGYEKEFDAVVVNDDVEKAVSETLRIVRSFLETGR
jgi:guanylate kinase